MIKTNANEQPDEMEDQDAVNYTIANCHEALIDFCIENGHKIPKDTYDPEAERKRYLESLERYGEVMGPKPRDPETVILRAAKTRVAENIKQREFLESIVAENAKSAEARGEIPEPVETGPEPWTEKEEYALELVLGGMSPAKAVLNADVTHRELAFLMQDRRYQQAEAERSLELNRALKQKMFTLINHAFDACDAKLRKDDPVTALGVLKMFGELDGTSPLVNEEQLLQEAKLPEEPVLNANLEMGHLGPSEDAYLAVFQNRAKRNKEQEDEANQKPNAKSKKPQKKEPVKKTLKELLAENQRPADLLTEEQWETLKHVQRGYLLSGTINPTPENRARLLSWLEPGSAFVRALAEVHRRIEAGWRLRAKHLTLLALECLERAFEECNGRVAMRFLRGLGVMKC